MNDYTYEEFQAFERLVVEVYAKNKEALNFTVTVRSSERGTPIVTAKGVRRQQQKALANLLNRVALAAKRYISFMVIPYYADGEDQKSETKRCIKVAAEKVSYWMDILFNKSFTDFVEEIANQRVENEFQYEKTHLEQLNGVWISKSGLFLTKKGWINTSGDYVFSEVLNRLWASLREKPEEATA